MNRNIRNIEVRSFGSFGCSGDTVRWHVVCRLLAAPSRESRRLAALLTRWPTAEVRRHLLVDDCARRQWLRGRGNA